MLGALHEIHWPNALGQFSASEGQFPWLEVPQKGPNKERHLPNMSTRQKIQKSGAPQQPSGVQKVGSFGHAWAIITSFPRFGVIWEDK